MKYNLIVRQKRVKNYPSRLRLKPYSATDIDNERVFAKIYKNILTTSRKVSETNRGDPYETKFHRSVVVAHSWAREALGRITTAGISFQQLYFELKIALQLERESAAATPISKVLPNVKREDIFRV